MASEPLASERCSPAVHTCAPSMQQSRLSSRPGPHTTLHTAFLHCCLLRPMTASLRPVLLVHPCTGCRRHPGPDQGNRGGQQAAAARHAGPHNQQRHRHGWHSRQSAQVCSFLSGPRYELATEAVLRLLQQLIIMMGLAALRCQQPVLQLRVLTATSVCALSLQLLCAGAVPA